MKKVVISGSSKLQNKIIKWKEYFKEKNYEIIDYPKQIDVNEFIEIYPTIHKQFFQNIAKTDLLFIMNEDSNNITGYIGAQTYAELSFGISQNLIYDKNIEILVYQMPSKEVKCYEEVKLYLELGWIKLYNNQEIL